jgi:hypothetical protein
MRTRRKFLIESVAGFVSTMTVGGSLAVKPGMGHSESLLKHIKGARVRSAIRREDSLLRLGGVGDNWHMTWAADDRQYLSLCDGFGWPGMPGYDQRNSEFNSRLYAIDGHPPDVTFAYLPHYPDLRRTVTLNEGTGDDCLYYNYATLASNGHIYQYLSALNTRTGENGGKQGSPCFIGAKLIYSPNNGRTWCNQDGSTPVIWEDWLDRSRKNMIFLDEPQRAFSLLTALQMGQNYEQNRDGYVYIYAPNGTVDGSMNELVMCRVQKEQILDRSRYRFFGGLLESGGARWVKDIEARAVVHTFPRGWVNHGISAHPYAWHPSVVYNAPLDLYMMANWGMGCAPNGEWFGKPSYLGFWVADTPWGPWRQIHEETAWLPGNDQNARAYEPQIAPKWISQDGRSFWLVWTDFQGGPPAEDTSKVYDASWKNRAWPYYAFNLQRVDLIVS